MHVATIAPWIVDSWLEALRALSFDLPTVAIDRYQARVALAASALALLLFAWHSVGLLPWRQRLVAQALLLGVLLAPVADFAASHADAMARWRVAFAHGETVTPGDQSTAASVTDHAKPSVSASPHPEPPTVVAVAPAAVQAVPVGAVTAAPVPADTGANSKRARVPAGQPSRYRRAEGISIYYGTNRAVVGGEDRVRFDTSSGPQLSLGRAEIALPPLAPRAAVERIWPVATRSDTDTAPRSATGPILTAMSHDAFLEASVLHLATAERDKGHVLVVIPGVTMDFEAALRRAAQLASDLDFDGVTFVFSWPSSGDATRYTFDRSAAVAASPHLAAFLKLVALESGASSVSLVVDGLGTELALSAIERIAGDMPTGTTVHNLILVAPDMARAAFGQTWGKVARHIEQTTLYAADTDRALNVSRRYTGAAPRAGDLLAGSPLLLPGLQTVDATAIGTDGAANRGAGGKPLLSVDIGLRLRRTTPVALPSGTERIATPQGSYVRYRAAAAP